LINSKKKKSDALFATKICSQSFFFQKWFLTKGQYEIFVSWYA
jgi:hypothetical protein